eukprot:6604821-Heterocapsa_arctica.AAC.1
MKNDNGESKEKQVEEREIDDDDDQDLFTQNKKPRMDDKPPRRTYLLSEMIKMNSPSLNCNQER